VKVGNIAQCVHAGAGIVVCGSSVYNDVNSVAENIAELRRAAGA
jgi:pentose-5-phosphate-3-epimerase